MNDLAKRAYDAWCAVMTARGQVAVPRWDQLDRLERQAWHAAANAVEEAVSEARVP